MNYEYWSDRLFCMIHDSLFTIPFLWLHFTLSALVLYDFPLSRRAFGQRGAVAVFVPSGFFDKPQLHRCACVAVALAQFAFQVAFVAPVEKRGMCAKDFESGRGIVVFLDHVIEFGGAVFEPCGRVAMDHLCQPGVELAGGDAFLAFLYDGEREVKKFGDILSGLTAGKNERCPGNEIKRGLDLRREGIAGVGVFAHYGVPFADDDDETFACFFYHAGDFLVECGGQLVDIGEQQTDIGLFDGGKAAYDAEMLDTFADFATAADAGGVHELDFPALVFHDGTVDVAGGTGPVGDDGLLFARQCIEEPAFADIRPPQ